MMRLRRRGCWMGNYCMTTSPSGCSSLAIFGSFNPQGHLDHLPSHPYVGELHIDSTVNLDNFCHHSQWFPVDFPIEKHHCLKLFGYFSCQILKSWHFDFSIILSIMKSIVFPSRRHFWRGETSQDSDRRTFERDGMCACPRSPSPCSCFQTLSTLDGRIRLGWKYFRLEMRFTK